MDEPDVVLPNLQSPRIGPNLRGRGPRLAPRIVVHADAQSASRRRHLRGVGQGVTVFVSRLAADGTSARPPQKAAVPAAAKRDTLLLRSSSNEFQSRLFSSIDKISS
jgi:hypothetical protein